MEGDGIIGACHNNSSGNMPLERDQLVFIQKIMRERTGVDVSQYKDDFLARQVVNRARKLNQDLILYFQLLQNDHAESGRLAEQLSICHTSFFRDFDKYRAFYEEILPELIRKNRRTKRLRIWSAGCASGEEPYSIAMMLSERLGNHLGDWDIEILATDVNDFFLDEAQAGFYSAEKITKDKVTWKIMKKYFQRVDGGACEKKTLLEEEFFLVKDPIKRMVRFTKHNLICDSFPIGFDAVFCRNVLIYIKEEYAQRTLVSFHQSLKDDGWLVLGNFESMGSVFITRFERKRLCGEIVYRKISPGSAQHEAAILREEKMKAGLGIKDVEGRV